MHVILWVSRAADLLSTSEFLLHNNKQQDFSMVDEKESNDLEPRILWVVQKQPSTGVLRKRCSENIQQIYRITPMPKWFEKGCCIEQPISCSQFTIITPELSSNLLVSHAFAYRVLVCFVSHIIIFQLRLTSWSSQ